MELTWFEHLVYGLISGFAEFLPISAVAHQAVFSVLVGAEGYPWLRLACHAGSLIALIFVLIPTLSRMRRERKIARTPKKRRRRQPDFATMMEIRIMRVAAISMILVFLSYGLVYDLYERQWLLALLLGMNGILLYIPQYLPGANKQAESLSGLDGMLIGLSSGAGVVPGFSRIGLGTSVALMRGADRRYAVELGLLLSIPALAVMILLDFAAGVGTVMSISALLVFGCITAAAAAFAASYFAIFLIRFLAVKAGFSGFAYYCWGLALFTLILYLI